VAERRRRRRISRVTGWYVGVYVLKLAKKTRRECALYDYTLKRINLYLNYSIIYSIYLDMVNRYTPFVCFKISVVLAQ